MNKTTHILLLAAALAAFCGADAYAASPVSDIAPYVYPANRPAEPDGFTYMPDGATYLRLSDDNRRIEAYDTKTGKRLDDYFDVANARETSLASIEGFTLSADASKIMVWRDSKPIYRRSTTAEYYVYEVRSRLLKPLSVEHPRQQAPLFSPDGRMVAFVADNNIFVKKLDYNTEVAVTTDGERNSIINGVPDWTYEEEFQTTCSMAWAPDNLTLCYLRYDESRVPLYQFPLYEGTCERLADNAYYTGSYTYKYPVAGAENSRVTLHSYDIETRKIKDITFADTRIEYIPLIAYATDPQSLIVATLNRDQNHLEIYSVNPKSTVAKSIYTEDSKTWITPATYADIHLGKDSFVVISSKSGYANLYQYSYTGAEMRAITTGTDEVTAYYGSDAAGCHYYQVAASSPLERTVRRIDRKGVISDISRNDGTAAATFNPTMDYVTIKYSNPATPPVYTLCSAAGKSVRTLEDNAAYAARYAGKIPAKEFFTFRSDGVTLNGYIIKPAGFDASRRYPAIMTQYSGPDSQSVLNRWEMDWEYYAAIKGYVVICVDGRGTANRGRDFAGIVYRDLGHYETIDQVNAARYAAGLPFVDSSRIGIFGWSYGGYEALMAITADDAPYAAAVAVAPVTDWRFYDTVYAERYMLTPAQNDTGYDASSALRRALRLRKPLLLMHGTADDNVHIANTMQYASTLQSAGILCDMYVFPNMNHSIKGCNARAVVYAKMLDFFDKNLR